MFELTDIFPSTVEKQYFQDPVTKELWFHATAICTELGFSNVGRSLAMYTDEDERFQKIFNGRAIWFVSVSGCYGLALASKTEKAKRFKRWLKQEIIPKNDKNLSKFKPADAVVIPESWKN